MTNTSGIYPQGHRLLVKPIEVEETTQSGIIINTKELKDREDAANTTGDVICMGAECFDGYTTRWCEVGDRVIFAKFAGLLYVGADGVSYRVINDEHIVATLDKDVKIVDKALKKGLML